MAGMDAVTVERLLPCLCPAMVFATTTTASPRPLVTKPGTNVDQEIVSRLTRCVVDTRFALTKTTFKNVRTTSSVFTPELEDTL